MMLYTNPHSIAIELRNDPEEAINLLSYLAEFEAMDHCELSKLIAAEFDGSNAHKLVASWLRDVADAMDKVAG